MDTVVDRIELFHLGYELPERIGNAARFFQRRETLLVKLTTRGGAVGWGETWALPAPAAALIQATLGPALLGEDVQAPQRIWRKLARFIVNDRRGLSNMAIAALDMAVWDARARSEGVPLATALGGALRDRVTSYASGPFVKPGEEPYGHYLDEVGFYLERGFRNVKIRAGIGAREDAAIVKAVRHAIGDDIGLMVDMNEAGDIAQTLDFAGKVEDCDLIWLEEPVLHDDLPSWSRVAGKTRLALAGGESLYSMAGFRDFLAAGVFAIAQPDLALCGGLTEGLRIAALAEAFNVPVAPHVWGSAVNFAASLHFAAVLPDRTRPGQRFPFFEFDASDNRLRDAFIDCPVLADGTMPVPQGPGLGFEIAERELQPFLMTRGELGRAQPADIKQYRAMGERP
ncbi:mandelate racemase/muconate lactonizing enzyme family protein [Bosea sp. BK604]|uniref:mandelate racemase/muconate lactonizing enzyme family protein n=1 Tax=Bosea sp. BK604 TaxID=2512180 RepID=UPI00104FC842|nr:mandelate racemase/muconate lactonizing enzyme family protein [Bosea sp. BK604]TCR65374.1 D-galactarolactone cycloisomerase [Bosea sp. BK604]